MSSLRSGTARLEAVLPDPELLAQFEAVAQLDEEDKQANKKILQAMIAKHQVKHIVGR